MDVSLKREGIEYVIRVDGRDIIRTRDKDEALMLVHKVNMKGESCVTRMKRSR